MKTNQLATESMKDLLIQIVKALVDNQEQVQVNAIESTKIVVLGTKGGQD